MELKPCRECGAPCRVEVFDGHNVNATIWMCSNDAFFGGDCPHKQGYLTEAAWNQRVPDPRVMVLREAGAHLRNRAEGFRTEAARKGLFVGPLAKGFDAAAQELQALADTAEQENQDAT